MIWLLIIMVFIISLGTFGFLLYFGRSNVSTTPIMDPPSYCTIPESRFYATLLKIGVKYYSVIIKYYSVNNKMLCFRWLRFAAFYYPILLISHFWQVCGAIHGTRYICHKELNCIYLVTLKTRHGNNVFLVDIISSISLCCLVLFISNLSSKAIIVLLRTIFIKIGTRWSNIRKEQIRSSINLVHLFGWIILY